VRWLLAGSQQPTCSCPAGPRDGSTAEAELAFCVPRPSPWVELGSSPRQVGNVLSSMKRPRLAAVTRAGAATRAAASSRATRAPAEPALRIPARRPVTVMGQTQKVLVWNPALPKRTSVGKCCYHCGR